MTCPTARPMPPLARCLLLPIAAFAAAGAMRWVPPHRAPNPGRDAPITVAETTLRRSDAAERLVQRLEDEVAHGGVGRVTPPDIMVLRGLVRDASSRKSTPAEESIAP